MRISDWSSDVCSSDLHAFLENYFKLNPSFAVYQGRHEFDGQLPDWSNKGLQAQRDFLKQAIAEAKAFDQAKMTKEQKFQRAYLIAVAQGQVFRLEAAAFTHHNPAYYIANGIDPNVYISRPLPTWTTHNKAISD